MRLARNTSPLWRAALLIALFASSASAPRAQDGIPSCEPESEFESFQFEDPIRQQVREVDMGFCAEWNPDFNFNGRRCCAIFRPGRRNRNLNRCPPTRYRTSYCSEMTPEQVAYRKAVTEGKIPDVLERIRREAGTRGDQSYCTVNNGFLAHGREIIPSPANRIVLRSPVRCLNFATDAMTGMFEWLGREIAKAYPEPEHAKLHLLLGDVSAPRGGCLWGRGGRRGHASHTAGQDADVGFLTPIPGKESPRNFHRQFDAKINGWFLKKVFTNPFACVKAIFLDRRHIQRLEKALRGDPEWQTYRRFVRHQAGHRDHFHIRVGSWAGQPGCVPDAKPELEDEETTAESDSEAAENSGE